MPLLKFVVWSLYACVFLLFFLMLLCFLVCLVFFDFLGFALEKIRGEVLWGLRWMCPFQTKFLAWGSSSNSDHVYKYPGCKSVQSWSMATAFPLSPASLLGSEKASLLFSGTGWGGTAVDLPSHWGWALQASSTIWEDLLWDPLPGGHPPNRSQLWFGQMPSGRSGFGALTFCFPLCCPSENCPGNSPLSF